MITTSAYKIGLLKNAIRSVTDETCTKVWCDDGYTLSEDGDAIHTFCKFRMSFDSSGDIDEDCVGGYINDIKEVAEMVKSLNAKEIIVDLNIEHNPSVAKNHEHTMKCLKALAEIGFPSDFDDILASLLSTEK